MVLHCTSRWRPVLLCARLLLCLFFALSLLGCAAAPLTLQTLHELNPNAFASRICGFPDGTPSDARLLAFNVAMNQFVTDRNPDELRSFARSADLLLERDASAPPSTAKLIPISMGLTCPATEPEPERVAISSEVHTELSAIIEQTCKAATLEGGARQFIGQHSATTTIVLGRSNPQFEARVRKLLGVEKIPEPPPSEHAPGEAPLRQIDDFLVEVGKGAVAEAPLTFVPGGSIGADLAIQGKLLPEGTRGARIGRGLVGLGVGIGQIFVGCGGTIGGIGLSSTGGGAIAGVPMTVGSLTLVVTGFANAGNSARRLTIEILRRDDGPESSSGPPPQTRQPTAKPPQDAPPPAAKPLQATQTKTTTTNKATGETSTKTESGTTTRTRMKPAPKEPQVSGAVEKTPSGKRVGDFTRSQKSAAKADNAARNGGEMACTDCGRPLQTIRSEKGVPTPSNQAQVHHDPPIVGGGGKHSTPVIVCPECHVTRHHQ